MRADIIIPCYNQLPFTKRCIESIQKNTHYPYRLILIDNGSSDDTHEFLKQVKNALVIHNKYNLGFPKAINQGLEKANAPYIVLLNNDVEVPENWLTSLIEVLEKDEQLGAVGPASSSPFQEQFYNGHWGGEYLSFFCVVFKKECIDEVGQLDENFGLGQGEDQDYAIRMKKKGWLFTVNRNVIVKHHWRTTVNLIPKIAELQKKNLNYLLEKWRKKVLIAILNQGEIRPELANLLLYMSHYPRHQIKIYYPNSRPISNNRNEIAKKFLKESWDYLLMIDSDVVPSRNPLELVDYDKDVIACPVPQWHTNDIYWVIMDKVENGYRQVPVKKREGLQEVDAVGTGCILIAQRVLQSIKAPFLRKWSKEGLQELGADFYFCEKVKEQNFKSWVHWDYPCSHFKTIDLIEVLKLLTKAKNAKVLLPNKGHNRN